MSSDLLKAAKNGYYEQVLNLLVNGPLDVNARDKDKATPLYWSASRGHQGICEVLIKAGCDVNACVKWGSTALHAAADRGHADCLALLIESGTDVNVQNQRGDTALHLAAYRGFKDIVQGLVGAWADPFLKNGQSKTPLQEAQSQQHSATADVLQKYIESLGCHPFKSLQESHVSKRRPTQDQPPSVSAKSWPRYQSFPKVPDNTPPTDLSRPHTYPLNNLSGPGAGGEGSRRLHEVGGFRPESWSGFGELSGSDGLLDSPYRRKDSLRQHVHHEPQEHAEEGVNFMDKAQSRKDGFQRHLGNGVANNHLGRTPSAGLGFSALPPCRPDDFGNVGVNQNDQDCVDGLDRLCSLRVEMPVPDIDPPGHYSHAAPGFVNNDDLTQFAESLQLEVVKLRESIDSKDRQVLELQKLVTSLTTRNSNLQRLADGKESALQEALALRDKELSDLKGRVREVEKKNVCLQQALIEQQARSTTAARHDDEVSELTARVSDLERMNSSLQQLIVTQQDTMKGMLASKDREISLLKSKVEALSQQTASLHQRAETTWQQCSVDTADRHGPVQSLGGFSAASQRPTRSPDSSGAACERSVQSPDSSTAVSRQSMVTSGGPDDGEVASVSSIRSSERETRSVISFCDQPAPQHPTHTSHPSTPSHPTRCFPSAGAPMMTSPSRSPGACDLPALNVSRGQSGSCPDWDARVSSLRTLVSGRFSQEVDAGKLDVDGREWTVGREFQLLDSNPVNCATDGQRRGSSSLIFSITHRGRKYMLKMLMNLINLTYEAHSLGRSLDAHLLHRFGAEYHAPLLLNPHPNIVRVRHHYQGDTSHFRSYLPLLVPPSLDVPIEMARRTTFLVLDQYPQTLQSFMEGQLREGPVPPADRLWPQFVLQLVYQLLAALGFLLRHYVVHRDIKADNVFLDWRLRPVLGDFGFARTLRGYGGQALPFTDKDQVFAGNPHAWAPELCRLSRTDPGTLPQPMTLEDVYSKSDEFAVSRMFYHLLINDGNDSNDSFPTSSLQHPHYPDNALPSLPCQCASPALRQVLKSLVLDEPSRRPTVQQALARVGVLLCNPDTDLVSLQAAEDFCASQLLHLSTQNDNRPSQPENGTLSVAQSVTANQSHCQADFLLSFSGKDFWGAYSEIRTFDN